MNKKGRKSRAFLLLKKLCLAPYQRNIDKRAPMFKATLALWQVIVKFKIIKLDMRGTLCCLKSTLNGDSNKE